MVNTELLSEKIEKSGLKDKYVAEQLNLSPQGFLNKKQNKSEFKASEIKVLSELLNLTGNDISQIFFAGSVELNSTN